MNKNESSADRDPRTPADIGNDITDQRLFDFYQENGLIGAGEDRRYSRDDIMNVARNAYWLGARDRAKDPTETIAAAKAIRIAMGLVSESASPSKK